MSAPDKLLRAATMAEELARIEGRRADLMRQLVRAYRWQAFCPDAFARGGCAFAYIGIRAGVAQGMTQTPWHEWRLELRRADGSTRHYPLGEVPPELIPDEYKRDGGFARLVTPESARAWRAGQAAAVAGEALASTWAAYGIPGWRAQAFRAGFRYGKPDGWHGGNKESGQCLSAQ